MRVEAVAHAVPRQSVSNDDVLERLEGRNNWMPAEQRKALVAGVAGTLRSAGTVTRYEINGDERPIDLVLEAGRTALDRAGRTTEEIDFVIYAGVGKGWIEPSAASAVQATLGIGHATSFDVVDACASWLRAMEVAHALIDAGAYRRGLIVNCECGNVDRYISYDYANVEELETRAASHTIGEAATATVVSGTLAEQDFHFNFRTLAEYFDLCMIPLPGYEGFLPGKPHDQLEAGSFFTRSRDLVGAVTQGIFDLYDSDPLLGATDYDIAFGHEVSDKVCEAVTRRLGVDDVYYGTHSRFGNTVAASVPLGMSLAYEDGSLKRGDRVLVIIGSAGVTVGFADFTF